MNEPNHVIVFRMDRTGPVHISEVISELLPKYARRPGAAAGKVQVSVTGLAERNKLPDDGLKLAIVAL